MDAQDLMRLYHSRSKVKNPDQLVSAFKSDRAVVACRLVVSGTGFANKGLLIQISSLAYKMINLVVGPR